ncbi:MAG: type II secretion system protein [Gammaproteobacteria bacterium]|nr:type II secretion system protein [Gammaproteobacteria bacterium]
MRCKGFTLTELLVVISILATLGAIAFNKYANLQSQARIVKAMAVYGSIREAASLAKASCTLDLSGVNEKPTCTPTGGTVDMDGTPVVILNQYPDATLAGIIAATKLNTQTDQVTIAAGNPLTVDINGGLIPECRISYAAPTTVGAPPTITLVTMGC